MKVKSINKIILDKCPECGNIVLSECHIDLVKENKKVGKQGLYCGVCKIAFYYENNNFRKVKKQI